MKGTLFSGYRKHLIFLIISTTVFLTISCIPHKKITINTLQPAEITIPSDIKNILVVNREFPANMDVIEWLDQIDTLPDSISIIEISAHKSILSLLDILSNDSRFEMIIPARINTGRKNEINSQLVEQLCRENNADLLIMLDLFRYDTMMGYKPVTPYREDYIVTEYERVIIDIRVYISFKILFPGNSTKNQHIVINETLSGLKFKFPDDDLSHTGNDTLGKVSLAGHYSGKLLGKMLSPYWLAEDRYIFTKGSDDLKSAANMILNEQFDEAIALLKSIEDSENRVEAYRARMNLSYCYEIKDILWKARKYALDAYRLNETQEALELANRLYERDLANKKLDEQLGN